MSVDTPPSSFSMVFACGSLNPFTLLTPGTRFTFSQSPSYFPSSRLWRSFILITSHYWNSVNSIRFTPNDYGTILDKTIHHFNISDWPLPSSFFHLSLISLSVEETQKGLFPSSLFTVIVHLPKNPVSSPPFFCSYSFLSHTHEIFAVRQLLCFMPCSSISFPHPQILPSCTIRQDHFTSESDRTTLVSKTVILPQW